MFGPPPEPVVPVRMFASATWLTAGNSGSSRIFLCGRRFSWRAASPISRENG